MSKLYCMQDPKGKLIPGTLALTKTECWGNSFGDVCLELGKEWQKKYWKREQASRRSAEKQGWKIVEAKLCTAHLAYPKPRKRCINLSEENGQIAIYANWDD